MDQSLIVAPSEPALALRFGGGDDGRAKRYLLATYGFLASKPLNTQRAYKVSLRQFFELFDWKCPEDITVAEAAYFKKWLMREGKSDSTVCLRMAALQSFFDYLMQPTDTGGEGLIRSNPFRLVTRKDVQPSPYARSAPVEWSDFSKILEAMPSDPLGVRDLAVLIFLAYTGRRRAEVARLRVGDIDMDSTPKKYRVRVKGGQVKSWEMPKIAWDAIRAHWISAGRLAHLHPDAGVFSPVQECPLTRGLDMQRPMHPNYIGEILKNAARRAGVDPKKVKVHGLRHMAARDLDRAGQRLQDIQRFLGHETPNTTSIYLGKLRGPAPSLEAALTEIRKNAAAQAEGIIE